MKTLLKILNLVYFILAGVAIACFTINFISPDKIPFLRMGLSADLTEENSEDVFSDSLLEKFNIKRKDLFAEGPIKVEVKVDITNMMVFNAWTAEDAGMYVSDEFINPTIDEIVEKIEPTFTRVAKTAAKSSIKTMVEDELKKTLPADSDLYQLLGEANPNLNSESLSNDIGTIIDELDKDGATLDTVNHVFNEIYNTYNTALGNPAKSEAATRNDLQTTLEKYDLVDENGNITSIDDAIAALLGDLLGNNENNNEADEEGDEDELPAPIALRRMLNPNYEGEEVTEEESAVAAELKAFVNSKLNSESVALGFKIAGIVWAVFVLAWAIKLIQCIICLFRKKPYIRVEIIGIIAGIAQVVLALISGLLLLAFKFGFITTLVGLPLIGGLIGAIPFLGSEGIGLELTFSAFIPGILVLVNLVYSIIYGFFKRSFKRSL